jgi:hypothetical protein
VLRQSERVGDRFVDHVVYAMLAAEWENNEQNRASNPFRRQPGSKMPG